MKSLLTLAILVLGASAFGASANNLEDVLRSYTQAYATDPMLHDVTFGIQIGESDRWHVVATKGAEDGPGKVELHQGFPEKPTFYFWFKTIKAFEDLEQGKMNAGTAMAKAFSTDETPMDVEAMEGFQPTQTFLADMMRTLFHFWNRSSPEVIPFDDSKTRFTHGSDVVIFYYQPGFRSGWFSIKPGQHVNEDENSRTNPFPSMMVFTRGEGTALIGDEKVVVREGQTLFIPPAVSHQFFNNTQAPLEGVLLMFGDGA